MAYATAVSSEVSQYILSRARELYLQRQRGDYLRKRSLELSKQYPLECTRALMQMSHCHHPGLRPETLPIKEEPEMRPAKCSGDLHQAIRVKSVTPRSTLRSSAERPSSGGTNKRIGEVAEKDSQRAARLVALQQKREEDDECERLRIIKEKFTQERQEINTAKQASRLKPRKTETVGPGGFIITDFNGERIQRRSTPISKSQPFLMVQMGLTVREERKENHCCPVESLPVLRKGKRTSGSRTINQMEREGFTLHQIQSLIGRDNRRKGATLGRVSRLRRQQMMSINCIACSPLQFRIGSAMPSFNIVSRLPAYFRATPALLKVAQLIDGSAVRYSTLFISRGGENHLLLKDGNIHVRQDWQAYSLLRASSKLMISSGAILRSEPDVFRVREGYGNPNVEELNQAFQGNAIQKTFFFSRTLSQEQIKSYVNQKLYEVVSPPPFGSVYETIEHLHTNDNLPITVEIGLELLNQYFQTVQTGKANRIDTMLISRYEGEADHKFIGPKLAIPLNTYYNLMWKSEQLPCQLSNSQRGVLTFQVYTSK